MNILNLSILLLKNIWDVSNFHNCYCEYFYLCKSLRFRRGITGRVIARRGIADNVYCFLKWFTPLKSSGWKLLLPPLAVFHVDRFLSLISLICIKLYLRGFLAIFLISYKIEHIFLKKDVFKMLRSSYVISYGGSI